MQEIKVNYQVWRFKVQGFREGGETPTLILGIEFPELLSLVTEVEICRIITCVQDFSPA